MFLFVLNCNIFIDFEGLPVFMYMTVYVVVTVGVYFY